MPDLRPSHADPGPAGQSRSECHHGNPAISRPTALTSSRAGGLTHAHRKLTIVDRLERDAGAEIPVVATFVIEGPAVQSGRLAVLGDRPSNFDVGGKRSMAIRTFVCILDVQSSRFRPTLGQPDLTEARATTLLWPSQGEAGTRIIMASPARCRSRRLPPPSRRSARRCPMCCRQRLSRSRGPCSYPVARS